MKTTATKVVGDKLKGSRWSKVVQDVWSDICITATTQQHHWDQVRCQLFFSLPSRTRRAKTDHKLKTFYGHVNLKANLVP